MHHPTLSLMESFHPTLSKRTLSFLRPPTGTSFTILHSIFLCFENVLFFGFILFLYFLFYLFIYFLLNYYYLFSLFFTYHSSIIPLQIVIYPHSILLHITLPPSHVPISSFYLLIIFHGFLLSFEYLLTK